MEKKEAEKRIKKLRSEIKRIREAYHVENAPNVTDDVYDSLTRELKKLLKENPEFEDLSAPENRVAGKPLEKFEKVKHKTRMLSLNDVFSVEDYITDKEPNTHIEIDYEDYVKKLRT